MFTVAEVGLGACAEVDVDQLTISVHDLRLVRDRAAGMALMKAVGLPLYLPLAWWFVDAPAGWLFGLVPTGWAAQALWAETLGGAARFAVGGLACSAVWLAVLLPRLRLRRRRTVVWAVGAG